MALGGISKLVLSLFMVCAFGVELEHVDFPEQMTVGGKTLVLNGAGKRVKRKFGFNWDVYVAGLYLTSKTKSADDLIASPDLKVLRMVFLRGLSKSTLTEAWEEGFEKNCKFDCATAKVQLKAFNDLMAGVNKGSELTLQFEGDSVKVNLQGEEKKLGTIKSEAFRKNLMAVFVGQEPPTEILKKALLGL